MIWITKRLLVLYRLKNKKVESRIVERVYLKAQNYNGALIPKFTGVLSGTDEEFTRMLMEGMSGYFFSNLYNPNYALAGAIEGERVAGNIKSLFDKSDPLLFTRIYDSVVDSIKTQFASNRTQSREFLRSKNFNEEDIEKSIKLSSSLRFQATATELLYSDVKKLFKEFISQFGVEFVDLDSVEKEERNDEISMIDSKDAVECIYVDPKLSICADIKLLIASMGSEIYNGNRLRFKTNKYGLPILEDYNMKVNVLLNELHSFVPLKTYDEKTKTVSKVSVLDQMFDKLDKRFKDRLENRFRSGFEWIAKLKSRLAYTDITGQKRDLDSLNIKEKELLGSFERSFSNTRNIPVKLIERDNGVLFCDRTLDLIYEKEIRCRWKNNTKALAKEYTGTTDVESENSPMIYIDARGDVRFDTESKEFVEISKARSVEQIIKGLRKLGFDFTASDDDIRINFGKDINENYGQIITQFKKGTINTYDDLFGRQVVNSRIKYFVDIECFFTADSTLLYVHNAEGIQQYSITQPSAISHFVNSVNSVKNITELILSNPQLGIVNTTNGEIVLNPSIKDSALLAFGGLLFHEDGDRKSNPFELRYLLGLASDIKDTWVSSINMSISEKVVKDVFHVLDGTYISIFNPYNSCEIGIHIGHIVSFSEIRLGSTSMFENKEILNLYTNALKDGLSLVKTKLEEGKYKSDYYSKYISHLHHFNDLLQLTTNKDIIILFDRFLAGQISETELVNNQMIKTLIVKFLELEIESTIDKWKELGLISINDGVVSTKMFSTEQVRNSFSAVCEVYYKHDKLLFNDFEKIVRFYTINRQLMVYEQEKLFTTN